MTTTRTHRLLALIVAATSLTLTQTSQAKVDSTDAVAGALSAAGTLTTGAGLLAGMTDANAAYWIIRLGYGMTVAGAGVAGVNIVYVSVGKYPELANDANDFLTSKASTATGPLGALFSEIRQLPEYSNLAPEALADKAIAEAIVIADLERNAQ